MSCGGVARPERFRKHLNDFVSRVMRHCCIVSPPAGGHSSSLRSEAFLHSEFYIGRCMDGRCFGASIFDKKPYPSPCVSHMAPSLVRLVIVMKSETTCNQRESSDLPDLAPDSTTRLEAYTV